MKFCLINLSYRYLVCPCKKQINSRCRELNMLFLTVWQDHFRGREWELTSQISCFVCTCTQLTRIHTAANLEIHALYLADVAASWERIGWSSWRSDKTTELVTIPQIVLSLHLHPWDICFFFSWLLFLWKYSFHWQNLNGMNSFGLQLKIHSERWGWAELIEFGCLLATPLSSHGHCFVGPASKAVSPCSEWSLRHRNTDGSVFYWLKPTNKPTDFSAASPRLDANREKEFRALCIQPFETRLE